MQRLSIKPTTFNVFKFQDSQNPYIDSKSGIDMKKVVKQHTALEKVFSGSPVYEVKTDEILPDLVFVANGGLCFPGIPKTILLPSMKYAQRRAELPYLIEIYKDMGLTMIPPLTFPFEGQAELKWFPAKAKAIGAYGFRSTKKSFEMLETLMAKLYKRHGLEPPELLVVPLESADYYHLDVAMLEFDNQCIVHKRAFSDASIKKMRKFLGTEAVHVIDVKDSFCLNAVLDGDRLITHTLDSPTKKLLEKITGL